ncbi:MAG: Dabb family protein [Acidobacteriota bacterium]|nr:Dabb family protein [Acidobacteriota bacterium]
MKRFIVAVVVAAALAAGIAIGANEVHTPPTILHVVVVKWRADSTPQQQQAAIDGIRKMAADVPGLKNVWVRALKVQPADFSTAFAMEFESRAAFDAYTGSAAHRDWEKLYLPYREESNTQDIAN